MDIHKKFWLSPIYFSDQHYLWFENAVPYSGGMSVNRPYLKAEGLDWTLVLDRYYFHQELIEKQRPRCDLEEHRYRKTLEFFHILRSNPPRKKERSRHFKYLQSLKILERIKKSYQTDEPIYKLIRDWRYTVLRITPTCFCGETANNAHHLIYKKKYPGLALNTNNGIGLCKKHHLEVHLGEYQK